MRRALTGEQLRFAWREAGGDLLKLPLQVLGTARTRSEAQLRAGELRAWWAQTPDPELLDAVRVLRRPRLWLECTTVDGNGRPGRGLLGAGAAVSTLVRQEPVPEQAAAIALPPRRPEPGPRTAWSNERGGDCVVETGRAEDLLACLCADLPRHRAADGARMSAPLAALTAGREPGECGPAGYSRRATLTPAERIRALAEGPRLFEAQFTAVVPVGAAGEEPLERVVWLVAEDGGRLFDGTGVTPGASGPRAAPGCTATSARTVRLRPAGADAVATAVRRMLTLQGEPG